MRTLKKEICFVLVSAIKKTSLCYVIFHFVCKWHKDCPLMAHTKCTLLIYHALHLCNGAKPSVSLRQNSLFDCTFSHVVLSAVAAVVFSWQHNGPHRYCNTSYWRYWKAQCCFAVGRLQCAEKFQHIKINSVLTASSKPPRCVKHKSVCQFLPSACISNMKVE